MAYPRPVAAALLSVLCSGCGSELYLQNEVCELEGDQRSCTSFSCTPVGGGILDSPGGMGTFGMGGSDDFLLEESLHDGSLVVVVRSGEQELVRHKYGEKQAKSGKRYTFTVTTHAGRSYEIAYWGVHRCDFGDPSEVNSVREN